MGEERQEINLMGDNDLRIRLLDSSVAYCINLNYLTKNDLPYLTVEFGYIFKRADGFIETLYKFIKRDGEVIYLALQEKAIMRIDFNETLFYKTVSDMKKMHPCLATD